MSSPERTDATAEILPALEKVYAGIKRVRRELKPEDRIVADLGIDSLATLEILLALEEEFDVRLVDNPGSARVDTIADLIALLDDLRQGEPAP